MFWWHFVELQDYFKCLKYTSYSNSNKIYTNAENKRWYEFWTCFPRNWSFCKISWKILTILSSIEVKYRAFSHLLHVKSCGSRSSSKTWMLRSNILLYLEITYQLFIVQHIEIHYHFIKYILTKEVDNKYFNTKDEPAYMMTKFMNANKFREGQDQRQPYRDWQRLAVELDGKC